MKTRKLPAKAVHLAAFAAIVCLLAAIVFTLWNTLPEAHLRYTVYTLLAGACLVFGLWALYMRWQTQRFAADICTLMDELMAGGEPPAQVLYEDSLRGEVTGKLLQYCDILRTATAESQQDKQVLQEIVSHISHQVKTPLASIKMFAGILRGHQLETEKREEFLTLMEGQIDKLDFLMDSLVKMSRLETGTFALHIKKAVVSETLASAINGVWAGAEQKNIGLEVDCDPAITTRHDPKWTAEAIGNILDNAVKYTPPGGQVSITVRPWQIYTRIDIADTGPGIEEAHYHDVFSRFWRGQHVAGEEGVGLGLYLAQGIITRQKGYISVRSTPGKGSVFSVYLLS